MHDFLKLLSDPVGMIGVILLLIAYLLISTGRIHSNSLKYQVMNFIGAWLILFSLFFNWNTPSVLIEIAWIIISIVGMARALIKNNSSQL